MTVWAWYFAVVAVLGWALAFVALAGWRQTVQAWRASLHEWDRRIGRSN